MISNDEVRVLWREARNGSESAFVELYRELRGSVYRFALHLSSSESIAEDVVQDVFLFLIKNPDAFDPNRGDLRSFVLGVARNFTMQLHRRVKPHVDLPLEEEDQPADPAIEVVSGLVRQERIRILQQAIAALPEAYREVILLCDLEELTYEQAAAALKCAVGTIRSRLHRARSLLLRKLTATANEKTGEKNYGLQIISETCK